MKALRKILPGLICSIGLSTFSYGNETEEKKEAVSPCEKVVDGKPVNLKEAKTRDECKKLGGKWKKGKDEHGHIH